MIEGVMGRMGKEAAAGEAELFDELLRRRATSVGDTPPGWFLLHNAAQVPLSSPHVHTTL